MNTIVSWTGNQLHKLPTLARRLWWWQLDLGSASYFASEWHDSVIQEDSKTVLSLVTKTRGGNQYYQNMETLAFDLSWGDLASGVRPIYNPTPALSELEAEGRNRALSVQRRAYSIVLFLFIGVALEVAGLDISLLT